MAILKLIIGVILFALATAMLSLWGNRRRKHKPRQLQQRLLAQAKTRVQKLLLSKDLSFEEVVESLKNLEVSSRPDFLELKVNNPISFTSNVLNRLEQENVVSVTNLKGKSIYKLVKS